MTTVHTKERERRPGTDCFNHEARWQHQALIYSIMHDSSRLPTKRYDKCNAAIDRWPVPGEAVQEKAKPLASHLTGKLIFAAINSSELSMIFSAMGKYFHVVIFPQETVRYFVPFRIAGN